MDRLSPITIIVVRALPHPHSLGNIDCHPLLFAEQLNSFWKQGEKVDVQTKIEEQLKCGHLSPIALILVRATPQPHHSKEEGASIATLKPVLNNKFCFVTERRIDEKYSAKEQSTSKKTAFACAGNSP